jgi:hypothetical protein
LGSQIAFGRGLRDSINQPGWWGCGCGVEPCAVQGFDLNIRDGEVAKFIHREGELVISV